MYTKPMNNPLEETVNAADPKTVRLKKKKRLTWLLALLFVLIFITLISIWYRSPSSPTYQASTDQTTTPSPSTPTTTSDTVATPDSTVESSRPANPHAGQIAISTVDSTGKVKVYYYDPTTNQVVSTVNLELESDQGGSIIDNDKVQFAANGDIYVYSSLLGGMGGPDEYPVYAQIVRYPDKKVILRRDETAKLFNQWLLSADGKTIYVLLPKGDLNPSDGYEMVLYAVNTATQSLSELVSFGFTDSPLHVTGDGNRLFLVESRTYSENDLFFSDLYLKTYDLHDQKYTESLLYKDDGVYNFPAISSNLHFGPNRLKAAFSYGNNGTYSLRAIDVDTQKETDLFDLGGSGQANSIQWSPDGQQILFGVSNLGSVPTQQGIQLYSYVTHQTTQLLKTDAKAVDGVNTGEAYVLDNSFNGSSFLYMIDRRATIYYYDIATKQTHEITLPDSEPNQNYFDAHTYRFE